MRTLISFEDALACVTAQTRVLQAEPVRLQDALGRTLSEPIVASADIPPFASSAMDGFALRSADVRDGHTTLEVIGHIAAGDPAGPVVTEGTCVEIMTGAPFPEGADAVAPIEWVEERRESRVTFGRYPEAGKHVRPAAEDVRAGDIVFSSGQLVTPPVVGMLAGLGRDVVSARCVPRVRIITTGNEVIRPGNEMGPGQIYNSNGPALQMQVHAAGGRCDGYEHAADDPDVLAALLASGEESDLIVFSGGVSVGDHDHVKEVLMSAGADMIFWKVRQRPGKPLVFGRLGATLFLGLPGNPVSSAMCFDIYGRTIIERMLGRQGTVTPHMIARLRRDIGKALGLHFFTRGVATVNAAGELWVEDTGSQRSNLYGSVVKANCIIHLPEDTAFVHEGSLVSIQLLPWALPASEQDQS